MNNDAYAAALDEIEEGRLDKGVWARSFADSGGDGSKAKALYIKARAESIQSAAVWQDTRPPATDDAGAATASVKVDSEGNVAQGIDGAKKTPDTSPASPYEAAIGERNQSYYLSKFEDFDKQGPGRHASWNWAAFFFTGYWALYRKMYVWFVAWVVALTFIGIFPRNQSVDAARGLLLVNVILWLGFTAYANSFYHRKVKARIAATQKANSDAARVSRRLSAGGGVHMWVPIGLGGLTVIGVVAAALPAYEDYTKRQAVAASAVGQKVPDWDNGVITPPAKRSQIDEFLDGAPKPAQSERGPWEQYQYLDAVKAIEQRNFALALSILRPLAEKGNADGQWSLAWLYRNGEGVAQNYSEAVKWFRLAAEQGHPGAQSGLSMAYSSGLGTRHDSVRALMWESLGALSGNPFMVDGRDSLAKSMTPEQIAQAEQMARDCQQRNFKQCD